MTPADNCPECDMPGSWTWMGGWFPRCPECSIVWVSFSPRLPNTKDDT